MNAFLIALRVLLIVVLMQLLIPDAPTGERIGAEFLLIGIFFIGDFLAERNSRWR